MKLAAAITGDLRKIMAEEVKEAEDAVTAAMRQAADVRIPTRSGHPFRFDSGH